METSFWWLKKNSQVTNNVNNINLIVPKLELEPSSSLADFLEKEQNILNSNRDDASDIDVGSIIDEINRVAAQSPLGPYEQSKEERTIEDIMKETERIYMESSKSFDQLSQRSKTSLNITELDLSKGSTPTPKSVSPLPKDYSSESETYSEDFSEETKAQSPKKQSPPLTPTPRDSEGKHNPEKPPDIEESTTRKIEDNLKSQVLMKDQLINTLEEDNRFLRDDIGNIKSQLAQITVELQQTRAALSAKSLCSPKVVLELDKVLEEVKDSKETNTSLQLQLDTINKTHCLLKSSYDDLLRTNKNLERRTVEIDSILDKYKSELTNVQSQRDELQANGVALGKLLDLEKIQSKSAKLQNEKDSKCIQDLNRQIKEMERIIARKHPDSVSALIVAAKNDASDTNLTARKVLEDRIKVLEEEASNRDVQSSRVFLDVQDKFNQMKLKYESHIDDLELHVNDLKQQLKRKIDTYDVYTQTIKSKSQLPQKDSVSVGLQTDFCAKSTLPVKNLNKITAASEIKEDSHLVATIRGLRTDLANKEKVLMKLQREVDEVKKTNRKLQKEREGSLKSLTDSNKGRESRSYPEKLTQLQLVKTPLPVDDAELLREERDKIKSQLVRMEEDFQALKIKRLHDLHALQEAHEREMSSYMMNVTPLRQQLEVQQTKISHLEGELTRINEDLIVVTLERDHLLRSKNDEGPTYESSLDVESLNKKIAFLEKRYEERELRLRAIIHGLVGQKTRNRECVQCAERQQQLIAYKVELDQLLDTLKTLK